MKNFVSKEEKNSREEQSWPDWMLSARKSAEEELSGLELPGIRDEEWKYTDLASVSRRNFYVHPSACPGELSLPGFECPADNTLVFINGSFSPELSRIPHGIDVFRAEAALNALPEDLRAQALRPLANDHPSFFALNLTFFREPFLIYIGKQVSGECHVLHYFTKAESAAFFPRTFVVADPGASLVFSETFFALDADVFIGNTCDVFLREGAALEYLRAAVHNPSSFQVSSARVHQAKDSRSGLFFFTNGGELVRDNLLVRLEGEGAESSLNGLHALEGLAHADSHTCVEHIAPSAFSTQLYKSILRDESRSVFNGKVIVRREAQKTGAYQLNRNLLLSPGARVDTKPQLEIMADDVRCTHGATIGQLDEDQLFYLLSRAIVREEALNMLVSGFIDDVAGKLKHPRLRKILANLTGSRSWVRA